MGLLQAPHSRLLAWVRITTGKKGGSNYAVDNEGQIDSMVVKDPPLPFREEQPNFSGWGVNYTNLGWLTPNFAPRCAVSTRSRAAPDVA